MEEAHLAGQEIIERWIDTRFSFLPKLKEVSPQQTQADSSAVIDELHRAHVQEELLEAVKDYLADLRTSAGTWTIERLNKLIAKAEPRG